MKPSQIHSVLDLTMQARLNGDKFNPLFVGPPGIGKSEVIQQWCVQNNLPFIDLRAAYLEAPDVIGFPQIVEVDGRNRTVHCLPEFWPTDPNWKGVVLLEEPNRGTTSVMNTFMQMLTDHKVHLYNLPKHAIIVGAINPEDDQHDVNTMDAALKNRFEMFEVQYDQEAFVTFMKDHEWDQRVQNFVRGSFWHYKTPQDIAANSGTKYISPRSLSKLNAALMAGLTNHDDLMQMTVFESILGKTYGVQFYNFISKERPVFVIDLLDKYEESIARLRMLSNSSDLKSGHISMLVEDIKKNQDQVNNELLAAVCTTIPSDQAVLLLRELGYLRSLKANELYDTMCKDYPNVKKYLQKNLKAGK